MPTIGLQTGTVGYRVTDFDLAVVPASNKATKPAQGVAGLQVGPLVPDVTLQYDGTTPSTLRDLTEGQDWICKRIVGKIHLWAIASALAQGSSAWSRAICCFGIFVARAEDAAPGNADLDDDEMDPMNLENIRNPWMFRRTWVFTNPGSGGLTFGNTFFTDNAFASGEAGSHVDVRVARRIRREERLWYAFSCKGADIGVQSVTGAASGQMTVEGKADLRMLGAMRRSNNRSTF